MSTSVSTGKESIQKFGRFLSGMVMPNIGAFIAWGLITALFIPTGWMPNAYLAKLVGPMITYLLPLLIGYTGGKTVAGTRGGVMGAISTMGVIVGADIPMFMGAMIMGPLGGIIIKKFDKAVEGKIPAGFEMMVNNFSIGILGAGVALLAYTGIGPVVISLNSVLKAGVETMVNAGLLPLVSLFVEPGKILFLNNAINHGVFGPIAVQQAKEVGNSIFFLIEPNPGPGLGILLAYWIFAKGSIKESAPGAAIIHFLGGIHEIYFPYVLMNPALILAVICGGASGVFTFKLFGAGLVAAPSPGSILALLAMTPKGGYLGVLAGVFVSTIITFVIAAIFVKRAAGKMNDSQLEEAREKVKDLKGNQTQNQIQTKIERNRNISRVIYACDAGMGSSAMGATTLKKKLQKAGIDMEVVNYAIDEIPSNAEVVVTHEQLTPRAKAVAPNAMHISVKDFMENSVFEIICNYINGIEPNTKESLTDSKEEQSILKKKNIKLNLQSVDKYEAIRMAGQILYEGGYVNRDYIDAMIERENDLSTYIGMGLAIPHGVGSAKEHIKKSGMSVLQFPNGVKFGEETAYIVIGIAGVGDEHLSILGNIATAMDVEDEGSILKLRNTTDIDYIHKLFTEMNE